MYLMSKKNNWQVTHDVNCHLIDSNEINFPQGQLSQDQFSTRITPSFLGRKEIIFKLKMFLILSSFSLNLNLQY